MRWLWCISTVDVQRLVGYLTGVHLVDWLIRKARAHWMHKLAQEQESQTLVIRHFSDWQLFAVMAQHLAVFGILQYFELKCWLGSWLVKLEVNPTISSMINERGKGRNPTSVANGIQFAKMWSDAFVKETGMYNKW